LKNEIEEIYETLEKDEIQKVVQSCNEAIQLFAENQHISEHEKNLLIQME
jgi:hypothetical protein